MRWPHSWSRNLPLFRAGLDLAFPPQCAACESIEDILPDASLCSVSWPNFFAPTTVLANPKMEIIAAGEFSGSFRNLILRAKYNADSVAMVPLIRLLLVTLKQHELPAPHLITQVPADAARLRKRGFYLPSYLA